MKRSPFLCLCIPLVVAPACKNDSIERERVLAERERTVADKERAAASDKVAEQDQKIAALERRLADERRQAEERKQVEARAAEKPTAPVHAGPTTVTVTLTVAGKKPNGQDWDALGDLPDPRLTLRIDRTGQSITSAQFRNQAVVTANFPRLDLTAGDMLTITAVEADPMQDDPLATFKIRYVGTEGRTSAEQPGGQVAVSFRASGALD